MATQKPIKLDLTDGRLKQFRPSDELPNQSELDDLKKAFGLLIAELLDMGIKLKSENVIEYLKYVK